MDFGIQPWEHKRELLSCIKTLSTKILNVFKPLKEDEVQKGSHTIQKGLGNIHISMMYVKKSLLVVDGFQGELVKNLDGHGVSY